MKYLIAANLLCAFVQLIGWYMFRELDNTFMSVWCAVWTLGSLGLVVYYLNKLEK